MPKLKAVFRCQECGRSCAKWAGQCPECDAWNTLVEEAVEVRPAQGGRASPKPLVEFSSSPVPLAEVSCAEEERTASGLAELDRLLGGGVVPGQVILLAGPPGIGKSTLMLQAAERMAEKGRVLYVSGEESPAQVSGRARRLNLRAERIIFMAETELGKIVEAVNGQSPSFIFLDSIQTVYHPDFSGSPGSVGQVRECAAELLRVAKGKGAAIFLLSHVTKEGAVAGPKVLEHIVDTVLQFDTERHQLLRVLRAQKNRFGSSSELGLFEMTGGGLRGVEDASSFFIEDRGAGPVAGRAVSVALEGSRPILAEVQALVTPTRYPLPRRMATGLDLNRVLVLIAAIEKHLHLRLESRDIFVSLAGGLRLRDPGLDLAVCLALVSSARDMPLPPDWIFLGEVGLLGNLGRGAFLAQRLREARRAGFRAAVLPARSLGEIPKDDAAGLELKGAEGLAAAVRLIAPTV